MIPKDREQIVADVHWLMFCKTQVEESVQTAGDEQILAPDELWAPRRASPEYWYQRKGN